MPPAPLLRAVITTGVSAIHNIHEQGLLNPPLAFWDLRPHIISKNGNI